MRKISRVVLDARTDAALRRLSKKVRDAKDPKTKAASLWEKKSGAVFNPTREKLHAMASGRSRCMYCEDSHGTDIEHFYPKARYPKRTFQWKNYLLACSHCNSNLKREHFPFLNGRPALLDPSADDPRAHLAFLPSTGEFAAIGPKGQPSIDVFGLNDAVVPRKLPQARKAAFLKLQLLLEEYEICVATHDSAGAALAKQTIQDEPFPAVLGWLVAVAQGPAAAALLRPTIPSLVAKHSVETWL